MTDREKLDALARRRMAEREAATTERQRVRTAAAARAEVERAGLDELGHWCEATFTGFTLPETGHVLSASKMPWSHASNVHVYFGEARLPAWADCVGLSFEHTGPETQDERRTILLVLVRAAGGGYEVVTEDGSRTMPTAEATKDHLIQFVADFRTERLRALFEKLSRGKFWHKS